MAELATIARPYAEALLKASERLDVRALAEEVEALGRVAADPAMRQFADNPRVEQSQVAEVLTQVVGSASPAAVNLVAAVLENGRFAVLPEIAAQFRALVDAKTGISQATIESAFALDDAQLADVKATMERRFGRKLDARVAVDPALIGGVRVVVGDEVLDTSIRARLEQMKAALSA